MDRLVSQRLIGSAHDNYWNEVPPDTLAFSKREVTLGSCLIREQVNAHSFR
jgi:hypothetical protein